MKRVELIIGDYPNQVSLDLNENSISIALQYSIDDIRDIDKKNSNYSKTITLPGTDKNNDAFGNLFDVNSTFDIYDPNKKVNAVIIINSSPVLEGYIQLSKVNKLNNADLQGNKVEYNVIVFDNSIDFIQTLGDKLLTELDLSDYNHLLTKTEIENAWNNNDYNDLYQYPLLDKATAGYETKDFKPAVYHKGLLLEIAKQAGYTLEGSFITKESDNPASEDFGTYHKELILWDGDSPLISNSEANSREFKAGYDVDLLPIPFGTSFLAPGTNGRTFQSLPRLKKNSNFDNITSTGFYDNTGNYTFDNPASGIIGDFNKWVSPNKGTFEFKTEFKTEVKLTGKGIHRNQYGVLNTSAFIKAELRSNTNGVIGSSTKLIGAIPDLTSYDPSVPDAIKTISADVSFKFADIEVDVGEEITMRFYLISDSSTGGVVNVVCFQVDNNFGSSPANYVNTNPYIEWNMYKVMDNGIESYFKNTTVKDGDIGDGDEISVTAYLPKSIKQKDLLSDLIRRYNVYVRKHPTKPKTLLLETRDDFYKDNVTVLDWTQKKDYSSEDKISFLTELQNKEILFTYKQDNSAVDAQDRKRNETYFGSTGDIYGQKKISFDNDFVQGTKKIESIFSSAPLLFRGDLGNDVIVPAVKTTQSKRNPVLAYWGGRINTRDENGDVSTLKVTYAGVDILYNTYPYAGHWNDPYDPTIDIHYGLVSYEYYGSLLNDVTDNNLFNNYWRNYINQISTGKLVSSKFYLTETDINFVKDNLNSRIFIKDSYYVINKIIDYKPLEDGLTTVELLRIESGSTFESEPSPAADVITTVTFTDVVISGLDTVRNNGPYRSNVTNRTTSPNSLIAGNRNVVGSNTTGIVNGDDNFVGSDSSAINVQGNNNVISGGLRNVTVVGDNQEVTESNTSYINGTVFSVDSPLSGLWEAGTGLDSVVQVNSSAPNTASNLYSITTGISNTNDGMFSGMLGGAINTINTPSEASILSGGQSNSITGTNNFIGGGAFNTIEAPSGAPTTTRNNSSIIVGSNNTVNDDYSVIIGGNTNIIEGSSGLSVIVGGANNDLSGTRSVILGGNTIVGTQDDSVYVPKLIIKDNYIPTSSTDTGGEVGQVSFDTQYMYYRTPTAWSRTALNLTW